MDDLQEEFELNSTLRDHFNADEGDPDEEFFQGEERPPELKVETEEVPQEEGMKRFDLRYGAIPPEITFHRPPEMKLAEGEPFTLHTSSGSASYVSLSDGTFIKVDLSSLEHKSSHFEEWTMSFDVRVAQLPAERPLALLQCHSDTKNVGRTQEAELNALGCCTVFDELPEDSKTHLLPGKWNLVTLRYGGKRRTLDVFVNGKKSVSICKGVMNPATGKGGRFSVPNDGFLLFASRSPMNRVGLACDKVDVRYVQFHNRALSDSDVKNSKRTSVATQFQRERVEAQAKLDGQKVLKPLYKQPPYAWQDQTYIAEFGDAVIGAAVGQPQIYPSLRVLDFVAKKMFTEQQSGLDMLSPRESKVLLNSMQMLEESLALARLHVLGMKNKNQMIAFVRKYRKKLDTLDVGACFMVPGMIANQQEGQNPFVVLLEKTDGKQFRFTLINTGHIGREYHYMSATSAPPKIQTRQVMVFNNVAADKVLDDGWWLMFWRLMMGGNAAMLYDDLLPLLLGQPLTAALEANSNHTDDLLAPLRTNQRSGCTGYRVLREAWTYYLLQHGVTVDHTLQVAFMYQQQWAKLVLHDMNVCNDLGDQVDESDIGLIKLVINHLCHVATVKVRFDDAPRFLTEQLDDLRRTVMHLTETYETLTIRTYGATKRSLELDDPTALAISTGDLIHDFYDHFLRKEDVNGLAGPAKTKPGFVPIDFLLVPEQATTFDEAIDALRWADKICTLVSVQTIHVQNPQFLKAALLQHLFTKIVTVPTVGDATCYWSPPMRYALQLDVILLLKRLLEHFVSSVFAINTTREFDAVRIVVTSVIMTIADVMLRKVATDIPSEVSTVWNQQGYGIKLAPFDLQSETIMTTVPELNIARTRVLDYWYDLNISPDKQVFNWNDSMYPDAPTMGFLGQVCSIMAFPQGQNVPVYLSGEAWLILKNYPEFEYYRDIVFYAKYMLADSKFHPPTAPYNQKMAELGWAFKQGKYVVGAFRMELVCQAKDHRWESYAVAQRFTNPHQALNEDDLLHIREFDFCEGQLGQRDSELILSYLTVPYMRIPLVLSFFATEDRIHSLKSETLKHLLDSVVFEPARYLHKNSAGAPQFVPAKNERLLNTAYGLLINELARSPSQVVTALIHLLKLALALDTGSYFASQTDIILYVIRLATRIENFILFVLSYAAGEFVTMQLRDTVVEPAVVTFLEESRQELRDIFENRVQPLLRRWIRECIKRAHALQEAERSRGEQDAQEPGEPNPAAASQLEQFRAQREQDSKTAGGFLDGGNNIPQDDEEEFFTRRMNRNRSPQKTQKNTRSRG
jgi:hypothetical protein